MLHLLIDHWLGFQGAIPGNKLVWLVTEAGMEARLL